MRRKIVFLGMVIYVSTFLSSAYGDDPNKISKTPQVIAVQTRTTPLVDEVTAALGYLPLDSFNRYISYGASYTHYYNGFEAWEVLNINKAINYDTGLNTYLQTSFLVSSYPFDTLDYSVTTSFVYTPLFNKSLWMESDIVKGETALVIGGGMAKFDSGFVNEVDAGIIFRFFLGQKTSLKIDTRYHFYFSPNVNNNLQISAGLSFSFGGPSTADATSPANDKDKPKEVELED
jgi:outer membrane beta-barrel protein